MIFVQPVSQSQKVFLNGRSGSRDVRPLLARFSFKEGVAARSLNTIECNTVNHNDDIRPVTWSTTHVSCILHQSMSSTAFISASGFFYPRDAVHSAVFAVVWCLSVRPSVPPTHARIVCKRLNPSLTCSTSDSPVIHVFDSMRRYQIPRGTPSAGGGRKKHGVGTFCDFRLKSPFISETVRNRSMVTIER